MTAPYSKREWAIEHGIPCPGSFGPRSDNGKTAREMQVGDSIFRTDFYAIESIRRAIYLLGGKTTRRKRFEEGVWGWRLWRTA